MQWTSIYGEECAGGEGPNQISGPITIIAD